MFIFKIFCKSDRLIKPYVLS